MASATALSAARSMPSIYSVPLGPRVRPPRLLPGTKAENTNPQPDGDVPEGQVWIQGKWRNPRSTAAKDRQKVQSAQVEKALRHATHGMHIYAYRQLRTNQVVYSLSRVMQNNKILDQLLFHGKQTKPAALRRDVWRPYFSVHFPQTPAGAEAGLDTYRILRELSVKRQLSPSEGFLIATEEDVEKAKAKFDPATFADMKENSRPEIIGLPRVGQLLPPKYRARKLMDQKESSVADVAFALSLIKDAKLSPQEKKLRMEKRLIVEHKARSRRNRRRINEIRRQEGDKELEIESRQARVDANPGQLNLDKYAAERIVLEHNGVLRARGQAIDLENVAKASSPEIDAEGIVRTGVERTNSRPAKFKVADFRKQFTDSWNKQHEASVPKPTFPADELEKQIQQKISGSSDAMRQWRQSMKLATKELPPAVQEINDASRRVTVLWSDLRDAMQAEKWSTNVQHDWLDAKAIVKKEKSVIRQAAFVDEDGHEIEEQRQTQLVQSSSSTHVMGRDASEQWFETPKQLAEKKDDQQHRQQWSQSRREAVIRSMISCRANVQHLETQLTKVEDLSEGVSLPVLDPQLEHDLEIEKEKMLSLHVNYPIYAQALDNLDRFSTLIARCKSLGEQIQSTPSGDSNQQLAAELQSIEKELRDDCDSEYPGFRILEQRRQDLLGSIPSSYASHHKGLQSSAIPEKDNDDDATPQSDANQLELIEAEAELEMKKVEFVLKHHQNVLQDNGADSWVDAAQTSRSESGTTSPNTSGSGRKLNAQELKDMNVEVDLQELDKRGLWSRVKGVFSR